MDTNEYSLNDLLRKATECRIADFDEHVKNYLKGCSEKQQAIVQLDERLSYLHNHLLNVSLHVKSNYLITFSETARESTTLPWEQDSYLTKQEVANRYRVSIRTINNWIRQGLQSIEIGGVKRISEEGISHFVKSKRSKKFTWRSQ